MPSFIKEKRINKDTQSWDQIWNELANELGYNPPDQLVQERYAEQAGIKLLFNC